MAIYTDPPEWEAPGKKPPSSKRTEGWKPGDRVPASWLNWFWFSTVNSLREIAQALAVTAKALNDHRNSADHDGRYYTKSQLDPIIHYLMLNHWTSRDSGTSSDLRAVAYADGLWVAVGDGGTIMPGRNGTT